MSAVFLFCYVAVHQSSAKPASGLGFSLQFYIYCYAFAIIAPKLHCLWGYNPPVVPLTFFQFYTVVQWKIEKLGLFGLRCFSKIEFPIFFQSQKIYRRSVATDVNFMLRKNMENDFPRKRGSFEGGCEWRHPPSSRP